jgi:Fe-S cluster biogenesis protein NfuA
MYSFTSVGENDDEDRIIEADDLFAKKAYRNLSDGGDIVLQEVDEVTGIVKVTLVGACGTCPASDQTLKAGIERIMRDRVDGVTEVVAV